MFLKQYGVWILQTITLLLLGINTLYIKNLLNNELKNYISASQFNEWRINHKEWEAAIFGEIKDWRVDTSRKLDLIILQHTTITPGTK